MSWSLLVTAPKEIRMNLKHKEKSLRFIIKKDASIMEMMYKIAPVQPLGIIYHEQEFIDKSQNQPQSKLTKIVETYSEFMDQWMAYDLDCGMECQNAIFDLDELDQKYLINQSDQGALFYAQWISKHTNFLKVKRDCFKQVLNEIDTSLDSLIISNQMFLKPFLWDNKVDRLTSMGFQRDVSEIALSIHKGNEEIAVHELLENQGKYTQKTLKKSTSKNSLSMEEKTFDKIANFFSNKKIDLDSPLSPSRPQKEENITVNMGRQLRTPYNFKLILGNLKMLFSFPSEHIFLKSIKSQTLNNLLDNMLTAVVLLVPKKNAKKYLQGYSLNLERLSVHNYDFLRSAVSTVDLLFKDVDSQFDKIRQMSKNGFKEGDFFYTVHSNLPNSHIVFHIICEDSDMEVKPSVPVLSAIEKIFLFCQTNDIKHLIFPSFLTPYRQQRKPLNASEIETLLKRGEAFLKALKNYLLASSTQKSSGDKELLGFERLGISFLVYDTFEGLFEAFADSIKTIYLNK